MPYLLPLRLRVKKRKRREEEEGMIKKKEGGGISVICVFASP
jgi:hypothetical protein